MYTISARLGRAFAVLLLASWREVVLVAGLGDWAWKLATAVLLYVERNGGPCWSGQERV
jgi:hypothetical protein